MMSTLWLIDGEKEALTDSRTDFTCIMSTCIMKICMIAGKRYYFVINTRCQINRPYLNLQLQMKG